MTNTASPVNYHVRIHDLTECMCKNVVRLFNKKNINNFSYAIEKEWNDDHCKNQPRFILVPKNDTQNYMKQLFGENIRKKKSIMKYFRTNKWADNIACAIRTSIKNSIGMFMCTNTVRADPKMFNSGIILIGSKKQMEIISHMFNKNIGINDEYDKLTICRVNSLPELLKTHETSFNFRTAVKKIDMQYMTDDLYTLVGIESFTNKLSFSFGKREWSSTIPETSYDCAKRELFEEFHIQLSEKIYDLNSELVDVNCLRSDNINIFVTWLATDSVIRYYPRSKTIYID